MTYFPQPSVMNNRRVALATGLFVAGAITLGGILMTRDMHPPYESLHPIAATTAQAHAILSEQDYIAKDLEGRLTNAITITMGATTSILPYTVISDQAVEIERILVPCSGLKSVMEMTVRGIDLDKALADYTARAKGQGYSAIEFISEDGVLLRAPIDGNYLSSHAMENKTGPTVTPHQVLSLGKDVQYLQGLREIRFSKSTERGFFFAGADGEYAVFGIDSFLEGTPYANSASFDAPLLVLLQEKGIMPARLQFFAGDGYSSVLDKDMYQYADLVKDGQGLRIDSSTLGKKHHIRNIERIGISSDGK